MRKSQWSALLFDTNVEKPALTREGGGEMGGKERENREDREAIEGEVRREGTCKHPHSINPGSYPFELTFPHCVNLSIKYSTCLNVRYSNERHSIRAKSNRLFSANKLRTSRPRTCN